MEHVVYKWKCKDSSISQYYIGYSKDFDKRIKKHKQDYLTQTRHFNRPQKKYAFVCENGGWYNWEFEVIDYFLTETDAKEYE